MYRFIRGRVCTSEDLSREHIWRGVARRLAEWHGRLPVSVETGTNRPKAKEKPNARKLPSLLPEKPGRWPEDAEAFTPEQANPTLWTVLQKWICALPTQTESQKVRKDVLEKELQRTVAELGHRPGFGQHVVCLLPFPPVALIVAKLRSLFLATATY